MGPQSTDGVIIKPPTDKRSYRILSLPNGLTAVLVHDPEIYHEGSDQQKITESFGFKEEDEDEEGEVEDGDDGSFEDDGDGDEEDETQDEDEEEEEASMSSSNNKKKSIESNITKKAAAAMCVGIGSFWDPPNAQGLAHFLEHMLFMGSEAFPDENEYDSYLSEHGGSSNAYTETEYTCYYFEVNREYLKGALQRFAQFFVSPLVKAEAMEREVLAVDSEFNQVLQSDTCRLLQLHCHTAAADHPFNRFFWGNKKSLVDAMESGVNLRESILQLYRDNYLGGIMKLVVIGGESLEVLEKWVVELFTDVKMGNPSKMSFPECSSIWKAGKLYRLEAVKDINVLELSWTLPCLHKEYLKKPEDYLAHLMGHEGKGSLLFYLKSKGWATSLSAGVGEEGMRRSSIAYIFIMTMHLTDLGLEMVHEVISVVYQYIKLLRQSQPQEWIFKELQDIANMDFRFAEEQPQDDYASELAENLLFYSEEHIIYGEYAFEQWDSQLIEYILSFFSPDNMRIDVLTKSFDKQSQVIKNEPWFGSSYIEEDIPESLLKIWGNLSDVNPALHLPLKNEFIPQDFSLRSSNLSTHNTDVDSPQLILDTSFMKFWHKVDFTFNVPRANTYFLITVKDGCSSARTSVLTELFVRLLKDDLNDILYQANVAKLESSLCVNSDKLELKLYGFNDKLAILLSKILTLTKSFSPKADRFEVIKEDMVRAYRNANMKPLDYSSYLRIQCLRECYWDVDEKLECLTRLSLSDIETFIPKLLSELYIEGLCHGNLSKEEAIRISNTFADTFLVQALPLESSHKERVICLPSGANFIRSVPVKNEFEVNSVVELYFQIEQDTGVDATRLRAVTDLFSNIVEEPCFNQLRTKEQLGYVVDCSPRMTYRVLGFCFRIQSSNYSPLYLHQRTKDFISGLKELLDKLDDKSFENHRSGLIAEKLEKDPSLTYETGHHWTQIVDKRYLFDMYKQEAEALKMITKSDVVNWYNTYLNPKSSKCRQLAVHVWGCKTNFKDEAATERKLGQVIEDLTSLKTSSGYYSSLC